MAKLIATPLAELKIQFELNYHEASALEALAGYGLQPFLKTFYTQMGESYLKPHEDGLKTLFEDTTKNLPKILSRFKNAQEVLNGTKQGVAWK